MDELVVDGEKYISSKRAARLSGYAKDYIGQLCRAGKIEAKMVGRSWYVKESAIKDHRKAFQGEPVIDDKLWKEGKNGLEFKGFGAEVPPTKTKLSEEHVKINYESDPRPLIPTIGKKESAEIPAPVHEEASIPVKKLEEDIIHYMPEEPDASLAVSPPVQTLKAEPSPKKVVEATAEEEEDDFEKKSPRASTRYGQGYKLKLMIVAFFGLISLLMLLESRVSYQASPEGFQKVDSGIAPLSLWGDVRVLLRD